MTAGKKSLLLAICVVSIAVAVFIALPPISQDPAYHTLADARVLGGVPNFLNVLSNLPFVLIGLWGLVSAFRGRLVHDNAPGFPAYVYFSGCIILTGFGSAYYHWAPDNMSLVWDRLPIALMTMAFLVAILSEHLGRGVERWLLYPLMAVAVCSVFYWQFTETQGRGDLRLYALVQFLPILIILAVCLIFRSRFTRTIDILLMLGFYVLARIAEVLDHQIMALADELISGHTLKHLLAAVAAYWVIRMLHLRKRVAA